MIKVNIHILQGAARANQQNYLRYYLAMVLSDKKRTGKVILADYVPLVVEKFQVKAKTVRNNLHKLVSAGYGSLTETHFYYRGLSKLPYECKDPTTTAIWIDWPDIKTVQTMRALCYQTALVHKSGKRTIARETLQEITGHSNKTQIKYEAIAGVKKEANYANLGHYTPEAYKSALYNERNLKQRSNPVFVGNSPITHQACIMRQIPNTYESNLKIGKRRYNKPVNTRALKGNNYIRRYYQYVESIGVGNRIYQQTAKYKNLWFVYDEGELKC